MARKADLVPLKDLNGSIFRSSSASDNSFLDPPSLDAVWNTVAELQKRSTLFTSLQKSGAYSPSLLSLVYNDNDNDDGNDTFYTDRKYYCNNKGGKYFLRQQRKNWKQKC